MLSIQGISLRQLIKRTRDAMSVINGSPITKDSKVRDFLVQQFGVSNEHILPALFEKEPSSNASMPIGLDEKLMQLDHFTAEEWAYLQHIMPLPAKEVSTTCQRCGSGLLPHGFCRDETCPHSDYSQDVDLSLVSIDRLSWEQHRKDISLTATTDDGQITVTMDASSYFYQMLRQNTLPLGELVSEDFDGGYACDAVLQYLSDHEPLAAKVLDYCALGHNDENPLGYHVNIEKASVKQFLRMAAPEQVALLN